VLGAFFLFSELFFKIWNTFTPKVEAGVGRSCMQADSAIVEKNGQILF